MIFPSDRAGLRLGAILAFFAVILGAQAAHGSVHDFLARSGHLDYWHTALSLQWYHALALLALSSSGLLPRGVAACWIAGVILFSGSLYILALDDRQHWAGPLTPLGGLLFLVGWAWLWVSLIRRPAADSL